MDAPTSEGRDRRPRDRDLDISRSIHVTYPRHSMYAIYAYIRVVWGVNVGIYGIHGVSGYSCC